MTDSGQNEYINKIQQHSGIIHKVIRLYVDNPEDQKDLFQEVLLQTWKSIENYKGNSAFSTWLYKVALNTVLTFNKKQSRKELFTENQHTETTPDSKDDAELIFHIIKSLGEIDRMLISLHLDGYKNKEIMEITGMNQNNVNVRVHRIKAKIIEKFKSINNE